MTTEKEMEGQETRLILHEHDDDDTYHKNHTY
jgi:hypothetical protein